MQYQIIGEPMPVVVCTLQGGEAMQTEKGSMVWMSENMSMETNAGGSVGKAFSRMFTGESMFRNVYTAMGQQGMIAFGSSFPGSIRALDVTPNAPIIAQKSAFLCAEMGVETSIQFQKKIGAGFFGGEGFIMQRISGNGKVFLEIDGSAQEYYLQPRQSLIIDTSHLVMIDATCTLSIETVKGLKNKVFGGEGFFNTKVTGPGRVMVQTMSVAGLAAALSPMIAKSGNN
ncbi:MAG TPA: TIGR00266 family protein [Candidatus Egerieicola faecale]|uniref:TIGR00266 family protein n=1 Tax=Candidatus Egerieicola faecale TaxID=2840774 RepID=A0A9D1IQP1_9FIRM|nr:TIGR00266 family protein [Candidatus Egerieicola faecale]